MNKAMGMFVALMITLSMLGVAVAHWSDSIQIEGTVHTGSLTVGWDNVQCEEENEPCGKDVASIECWLEDEETDPCTGKTIWKTLVIEIENAYPCWLGHVAAGIKNAGTIPVDLVEILVEGERLGEDITIYIYFDWPGYPQLDPCNTSNVFMDIHVDQDARECMTYLFKLRLNFTQWGYVVPPSRDVEVTISPTWNSAPPGQVLEYTVTVRNTGTCMDTYALENSDDQSWTLALDDDSLTVPAGESRTTTLRVTIPEDATPCTEDIITVTATSQVDPSVSDSASCIAHAAEADWPMFHHDLRNTGYTTSPGPTDNHVNWIYQTGGGVFSSPAVADGKVYIGSCDDNVYCLNADNGDEIWTYQTGFWVHSSPAVADGKVYIGSLDYNVYCLNADNGDMIWTYTTGGDVYSPPAVADGKVYVGSYDDKVYCLNADNGDMIWTYQTGHDVRESSPAVADGKVYIGSLDDKVYCLNADNGDMIWTYTTGGDVFSSPAVADGRVYIGSYDDNVYCLNADNGDMIWTYQTGGYVRSSPAVADGKVYIGSYDDNVYCLNADNGDEIWTYQTGSDVRSSPAVADGRVYIGSYDDNVYCLNADNGDEIWAYQTGFWVFSSPAVADGKVYIGSVDFKVYCFGPEKVHIYDFTDSENNRAYEGDCDSKPPSGLVIGTEIDLGEYVAISASDDNRAWYGTDPPFFKYHFHRFEFKINEPISDISQLYVMHEGYGYNQGMYGLHLYIWNYTDSNWEDVGYHFVGGDIIVDKTYTSGFDNYIDENGYLNLLAVTEYHTSSCPYLYAWDGTGFEFIEELNTPAALGCYDASAGKPYVPKTEDYVKIDGSQLEALDGTYRVEIADDQDEILYLDRVKLLAVDHSPETEIYSPTMIKFAEPYPFNVHTIRDPRPPISAVDENGTDILPIISKIDRVYTEGKDFYWDTTTVDFGDLSEAKKIKLLYSTYLDWPLAPNVAARYLTEEYRAYVEVINENGDWENVSIEEPLGLPQAKQRTVVIDITNWFKTDDYRVRIHNWEKVCIDYIAADISEDEEVVVTELDPVSADLHWKGVAREYSPDGKEPYLADYYTTVDASGFDPFVGYFTRYGDVLPLLTEVDDKFVIMRAGDDVSLEFEEVPLQEGMERDYYLFSDAYYKQHFVRLLLGENVSRVEPLPFHGMFYYPYPENEGYPYDAEHIAYLEEYNTREWGLGPDDSSHNTIYTDYVKVIVTTG